ncbi:hypothetical protein [Thermus brockianus]
MRGGPWDAGFAVEEVAAILRDYRAGHLGPEEALEEVARALMENNFGRLLEEEPWEGYGAYLDGLLEEEA